MTSEGAKTSVKEIYVPQGWPVFAWGFIGSLLGLVPALLLLPNAPHLGSPWDVIAPTAWACFVGGLVTYFWSSSIHKRLDVLRSELDAVGALTDDEKARYPGRLRWMPAWLGLFERIFYSTLIGLDVAGGATFIGVWVALKLAGGWQVWSKGTMYGHAIFVAGLLGNAMSVLFGVVAGLTIRAQTP